MRRAHNGPTLRLKTHPAAFAVGCRPLLVVEAGALKPLMLSRPSLKDGFSQRESLHSETVFFQLEVA